MFCKFGDECAYLHLTRDNSKEVYTEVIEDVKNLKAEVELLKKTVKSQAYIKEEAKIVMKEIKRVKEEISQLKAENLKTEKKISMIEEDLQSQSESEGGEDEAQEKASFNGNFSCEHCNIQFGIKRHFEIHMKRHEGVNGDIACLECNYSCKRRNTFQKHMNMKHPKKPKSSSKLNEDESGTGMAVHSDNESKTETVSEEEELVYQVEIVDGKPVFTCNLCDEGFYDLEIIEKHIEDDHGKIVTYKEWTECGGKDCGICSECTIMKKYDYEP